MKITVAVAITLLLAIGGPVACKKSDAPEEAVATEEGAPPAEGEPGAEKPKDEEEDAAAGKKQKKVTYENLSEVDFSNPRAIYKARKVVSEHVPKLLEEEEKQLESESEETLKRERFQKSIDGWLDRIDKQEHIQGATLK